MNQWKSPVARLFAHPDDIEARDGVRRTLLHLEEPRQALYAHGKADAGDRRPAELFNQSVIAPARGDRALGAQLRGGPFERRPAVVIEAPHHARIERVFDVSFT